MVKNIIAREYLEIDREAVLKLHRETFFPVYVNEEDYKNLQSRLEENLCAEFILVAEVDGQFAGFATYVSLGQSESSKENVSRVLGLVRSSNREKIEEFLREYLKSEQKRIAKGDVVLEIYDNAFSQGEYNPGDEDIVFGALAVCSEFRRKGIGTVLTKSRIEVAKQLRASAIFVSCWEGGHVSKMYEKLEFLPILRGGPKYNDGNAVMEMGLLLE